MAERSPRAQPRPSGFLSILSASIALDSNVLEKSEESPIEMTLAGRKNELELDEAAILNAGARNSQTV
jgi:hypothetical protein